MLSFVPKRSAYVFLILITTLGIFFRLYKITNLEPYIDEASIGYNAYLLANYQTDEWQSRWPLHFQAFGEWKLPVYIYSTAIIGKIIGFNNLTIQLASVLAGFGIAVIIFLWAKKLSRFNIFGLLAVNFYLFNFWSFMISRGGFEANLGLFFTLLAVYLYYQLKSTRFQLSLAALFLVLAFFTYNSARLLAPFIFIALASDFIFHNRWRLKKITTNLVLPLLFWLVGFVLVFRFYQNPTALIRFNQVSQLPSLSSALGSYLYSFSYTFWVGQGDQIIRHTQPGFGNSDIFSYFLFLFGLIYLIRKQAKKAAGFLLVWFIALLPSILTNHPLHNLRSIFILPLYLTLILFVLFILSRQINRAYKLTTATFAILATFLLTVFSLSFFANYFRTYVTDPTLQWGTGYLQLIKRLNQSHPNQNIYIDTKRVQPYIYWAWYLKTPPQKLVRNTPDKRYLSSVAQINNVFFLPLTDPDDCYKNICYKIKK